MNINRNNYEEFFLLYIDNELNVEQKAAVDSFIAQNPDLAIELKALQQTVIPLTHIQFNGKALLLKNESTFIHTNNYEEKFLLYIDNELNDLEKTKVETFVLQHPQLQQTFTLLQQTKLAPETIIYPNKNELYKKEERKIVYLNWQRIAVAASVFGLIVLGYMVIQKSTVSNKENIVSTKTITKPSIQTSTEKVDVNNTKSATTATTKEVNNNVATTPIIKQVKKSNNLPVPLNNKSQEIIIPDNNNKIIAKTETVVKPNNVINKPTETITVNNNNDIAEKPSIITTASHNNNAISIQPTVYKELNTDDDDESNPVYVGNLKLNKTKVKNFLRKATNLFGKPHNNDVAETVVASSSIKQSK
ncbi:MAG: hypothetical protein JSR09_04090 [Bacteroidetes bacterium]|nr:hypothetical protein [Bacteroidota bacterium]MBS1648866.1 hypothetical protein [Bacteroidota bacterium]